MEIKVDRNIYSDSCISKVVYDFDVNDFWDKMNDFKLREIINTETRDIKTILYAKAFGEFDNLDENDFD